MKSKGIIRKIDKMGRVVIPNNIRKNLNIDIDDNIEIFEEDGKIVICKAAERCLLCGSESQLLEYRENYICRECIGALSRSI